MGKLPVTPQNVNTYTVQLDICHPGFRSTSHIPFNTLVSVFLHCLQSVIISITATKFQIHVDEVNSFTHFYNVHNMV